MQSDQIASSPQATHLTQPALSNCYFAGLLTNDELVRGIILRAASGQDSHEVKTRLLRVLCKMEVSSQVFSNRETRIQTTTVSSSRINRSHRHKRQPLLKRARLSLTRKWFFKRHHQAKSLLSDVQRIAKILFYRNKHNNLFTNFFIQN